MNHYPIRQLVPVAVVILFVSAGAGAQDWPQWGRDASKNMTAPDARGIPSSFDPGRIVGHSETIDPATTHHIKWIAKLGSQSYGNVTVSGGASSSAPTTLHPAIPNSKAIAATSIALMSIRASFYGNCLPPNWVRAKSATGNIWASALRPRLRVIVFTW